jgi:hypothetical protein
MQHRHLDHDQLTPAAIDDIIQRGKLADWTRLARALQSDSSGSIAGVVRQICTARRRDPQAPSHSFSFWMCYLDALRQ